MNWPVQLLASTWKIHYKSHPDQQHMLTFVVLYARLQLLRSWYPDKPRPGTPVSRLIASGLIFARRCNMDRKVASRSI